MAEGGALLAIMLFEEVRRSTINRLNVWVAHPASLGCGVNGNPTGALGAYSEAMRVLQSAHVYTLRNFSLSFLS
jgi:hypothetical protein